MTELTKQILIAFGIAAFVIVGGLVALVAGVLYFTSDKDFDRKYEASKVEGGEFGKATDQQGCMQEGLKRAKKMNIFNINQLMINKGFVSECLTASRPTPGFCNGVPSKWTSGFTEWEEKQCKKVGMDDVQTGCKSVFEEKVEFCSR